ncbi:cystatin-B-like [Sphaeramia orbicularis]|uniref:cystatin-B-like n=1 Tax=Sphaeramia orbicularis TaxID=375764 RepID=UPI00117F3D3F|nr:cystatin-B-like [Sphaeramia orbicularis]
MAKNPGHRGSPDKLYCLSSLQVFCGGFGPTEVATQGFVVLCYQLKSSAEGILNKKYEYFTAISYRSQIVAGTNFIFKIHAGGENYVHMSVFWALPCNGGGVTVMGAQENKSKTDPIVPF